MEYVEKLNSSPIFETIVKNFDYEKIGLQILNNKKIIKEFTSHNQNGKITKVEEKLNDPDFTAKIEEKVIQKMIKEQTWIEQNPIEAAIKYARKVEIPFIVKLKLLKLLTKI